MGEKRAGSVLVVKLGGSLAETAALKTWLAALANYKAPLVVVPGGGAFADIVRAMQPDMGYDDKTAHSMALLAMKQYALALTALWPRLISIEKPNKVAKALKRGETPCWTPSAEVLDPDLPQRWEVTSDTLAASLAGTIEAARLLLIKSLDLPPRSPTLAELARAGVVDPLFPKYAKASGAEVFVAGPSALADAATMFAQGSVPGSAIALG
ncbi:MAG TPA: uridylate kinase [Methylovirgula sp.]|jgi:dihydroneopterin aldolase